MTLHRVWGYSLGLMVVVVGAPAARAQVAVPFFTDNFNAYADGGLEAGSGGNWIRHSGTAGTLAVADGKVQAVQPGSADEHRDTGSTLAFGGSTWYYALKFTVTDTRAVPGTGAINPAYFIHFMEDIDPLPVGEQMFRGRLYVQGTNDPTKFTLGLSSGTVAPPPTDNDPDFDGDSDVDGNDFLIWQAGVGAGTTNATGDANASGGVDGADLALWAAKFGGQATVGQRITWGSDLSFDTEYTAVVSYTSDDDDTNALLTNDGFSSLWVNPTTPASTSITDTLPHPNISNDSTRPIAWLAIRQSATAGANGPARVNVDVVSIGTDFGGVLAAVAAGSVAAAGGVPEPSSAALVTCGALAAVGRLRRRAFRRRIVA